MTHFKNFHFKNFFVIFLQCSFLTYRLVMLESNQVAPFHWQLLSTMYIVVSIVRVADHQLRNNLFERRIPAKTK